MLIELREYSQMRPNGDRATRDTKCARWTVIMLDDFGGEEVELAEFDQWDSFHCHVNPRERVFGEARKYARRIALFLGTTAIEKKYRKTQVVVESWEEDTDA